ncbi:MAG: hypothetical protein ACJ74J_03735 [Blastocatellia bacterium]
MSHLTKQAKPPTAPSFVSCLVALLVTLLAAFASGCNHALLDERFHSNDLSRWTVVDDLDTVEGPSEWRVEADGWLHQRSNIWGRRGDFIGRWYGTMLIAGDASWRDYRFSVRALAKDNDGFGVIFRFQDREHFYRLIFIDDGMSGGPLARLDKRDGADYNELWSEPRAYRQSVELQIEVIAEGDHLRGSLNGQVLFDLHDASYANGKAGLFCYAQSDQMFDDVRVSAR